MKQIESTFAILFICVLQVACQDATIGPHSNDADYSNAFPLAVGNQWTNEVITKNLSTGKNESQLDETIQVYDKEEKKELSYKLSSTVDYLFEAVFRDSSDYVIRDFGGNHPILSTQLKDTIADNSLYLTVLIAVDSAVTTPAGTFKTLVYQQRSKGNSRVDTFFFANNVGMVKRTYEGTYENGDSFVQDFQLKEYHLEEEH